MGYIGIHAGNIRMLACVADPLNLLYRLYTDCTNGLDECVGRLQRRITDAYDCQVSNIRKHLNAFSIFLNNVEKCNFKKPCKDVFITNFNNVSKCNLSESFHLAQGSAKHFFPYIRMSFVCNKRVTYGHTDTYKHYYYTLHSSSVFSLAKSLQLFLERRLRVQSKLHVRPPLVSDHLR